MNPLDLKSKEIPEVTLESLYDWIEDYKWFLCHSMKHNTHANVEKSLEYMGVITALVQRVDHLERREAQLETILLELNERLTKQLEVRIHHIDV